ncbi:MAG TPA: hypothetical protein VF897_17885 [Roseiflexaceae bacterium]
MAGAAPERTIDNVNLRRGRAGALAFPWIGAAGWLPVLLALATVLAVVAAYSVRPFVTIDVGDYYDTPYLPDTADRGPSGGDFYAREVGPFGPEQAFPWPAEQAALLVPGRREGIWQVIVRAATGQPDDALEGLTVSANGVRLWIPRSGPRELVGIIPAEIAAAAELKLQIEPGLVGDPPPPAGLAGEIRLAPARTYRWTSGHSTISLPGLGRGDWRVALTAILQHPDGQPLDAMIAANGVPIARLPDDGLRRLWVFVPAALVPDGDLTLSLSSNTYKDPRELGVLLYEISVAPAGSLVVLPPLKYLLYALVIALCLYFCLLRMIGRPPIAAALALLVVLGGAWALAAARFPTTFMLPRLAVLALWSVALLLLLEWLVAWVFRTAGAPLSPGLLRALLLTFFVGYWIKAGGMLYPYFVGIDMQLQMAWARQIFSGEFWRFYGTSNPMNERTMPTAEWGANRPIIPYSPWFHIFAGSFMLLPLPMALTGHMVSALVDTSRVLLIALLGRKVGFSERESLFGALMLAVTPVTFLLHSWGNLPTTLGIWWTLVSTVFIVAAYPRLDRRWPFVTLTLLLTATMLFYTVMAAFMMLFLALLIPALWLAERSNVQTFERSNVRTEIRPILAIALAALAALGLSTLIYYGQYIPLIVERTVPYFLGSSAPGQQVGKQEHQPFLAYLADYWPRFGYDQRPVTYGLQLLLLLAAVALAGLKSRRALALMLCWAAVAALFVVAGSRISMVDKQIFYLVPALALLSGQLLGKLWARSVPARLVVAGVYLFTFASALSLWVYRIMTTRQ